MISYPLPSTGVLVEPLELPSPVKIQEEQAAVLAEIDSLLRDLRDRLAEATEHLARDQTRLPYDQRMWASAAQQHVDSAWRSVGYARGVLRLNDN